VEPEDLSAAGYIAADFAVGIHPVVDIAGLAGIHPVAGDIAGLAGIHPVAGDSFVEIVGFAADFAAG
jgi:hypothetical protein